MNYKETLFFIAKCLTISHEKNHLDCISEKIKSNNVDWDQVVRVSTAHYVFPALYCNLKRAELLPFIPEELVSYMKYITNLNRERNLEIIDQAKEINELLLSQNITAIFLKGTGFLVNNMYQDLAERMVGDIDFLVSDYEYERAVQLLKENNYSSDPHLLENVKLGKHYPRITHKNKIAAVEIHFRIIKEPYEQCLNYNTVKDSLLKTKDEISIVSYHNQVLHTIFNFQTNDLGYWFKFISLRNYYDLFLLSKKTNTLTAIKSAKQYFTILNSFLASCYYIFDAVSSIEFVRNKAATNFVNRQIELLDSPKKMAINKKKWSFFFDQKSRFKKLKLAFVNKDVRAHLYNLLLGR